jgi:RNA polymerase sigma-70 factor (ECF subfamily)
VAAFLSRSDEASFRSLYRAHTPVLYRLALRMLDGGEADAEEAVQAAWIRAVEGLRSFRWESSLRTWLTGITLNCCREIRRRSIRDREAAGPLPPPSRAASPPPLDDTRVDLSRAVAGLPDGYREVLVLHDVEGLTHEEIATAMGIEIGTSKSQLHRARQALRARLAGPPASKA